ncbi:hypothetical protein HNQ93_003700 [Hymenobacter luteus]|uniref:Uncharacterized protein n=2 Tax=Hymenobacter TaxID=89966 RepID=A0A7W9T4L7_9BACT|nr:hypothetical protein [Hymenobacter latericoloratus]MBB6060825.1 hypothetical protein [Hymenobacter luteus]
MICWARLSPMPEPPGSVVKNGMKMLSSRSGAMPRPLSTISSTTYDPNRSGNSRQAQPVRTR